MKIEKVKLWREITDCIHLQDGEFSAPGIAAAVPDCGPNDVRVVLNNMNCIESLGEAPGERNIPLHQLRVKPDRPEHCGSCYFNRRMPTARMYAKELMYSRSGSD